MAVVFLSACNFDVDRPSPAPGVRSVVPQASATGMVLQITPDTPSAVEVEYWTDGDAPLTLFSSDALASVTLPLPQLRPGRTYQYDVRTVSSDGITGVPTHGEIVSPPAPDAIQNLHLAATGTLSVPLVMIEVNGPYSGFVAVNGLGEPVWHFTTQGNPQGFTRRANGNFVFLDGQYGLFEVTPDGRVVHQLANAGGHNIHHDVVATPQNTLLFIAQDPEQFKLGWYTGEAVYEWSPETGVVVKRWSSDKLYDPSVNIGSRSTPTDWLHGNSLALGDHGNVILSLNWISQVISIASDWNTIEWRLGGVGSTIQVDSSAFFQGQHTAQVLPNGHALMFDNSRDLTGALRQSRALEVAFTPGGTATQVWSFSPSATQYDPFVGSARRLANGNTLVYFGMRDSFVGASGPMAAYEVTPNGSVAWRLTYDGGDINYRATPLSTIAGEMTAR